MSEKLSKKVLVIDDEQVIVDELVEFLGKNGYDPTVCMSAETALATAKSDAFDLIISDIRMPEMDGIEAARKIRTMDRRDAHAMPLIAMSADAFEEDISKSLANGINAHLIKPIDAAVLYRTLAQYIPQKS